MAKTFVRKRTDAGWGRYYSTASNKSPRPETRQKVSRSEGTETYCYWVLEHLHLSPRSEMVSMSLPENVQNISLHATAARRAQAPTKSTILIAEDNADSREVMATLLRLKGFQVIAAENGVEALDHALLKSPDLILLDFELPGLNGLSVVQSLRATSKFLKTPIVIVSGHDPARYRQAALNAGCDDYLVKPVDFDSLDRRLHELIGRSVPVRRAG